VLTVVHPEEALRAVDTLTVAAAAAV